MDNHWIVASCLWLRSTVSHRVSGAYRRVVGSESKCSWPRLVAHARQSAWDYGDWQGFEQFRVRAHRAESLLGVSLVLLVWLFMH